MIIISIVIEHDFCSAISVEIKGRRGGGGGGDLSILEIEVLLLSVCTCSVSKSKLGFLTSHAATRERRGDKQIEAAISLNLRIAFPNKHQIQNSIIALITLGCNGDLLREKWKKKRWKQKRK